MCCECAETAADLVAYWKSYRIRFLVVSRRTYHRMSSPSERVFLIYSIYLVTSLCFCLFNWFSMQDNSVLCVHIAYFFTREVQTPHPQFSCFSVGIFPGFQLEIPYENAFTRELPYLSVR